MQVGNRQNSTDMLGGVRNKEEDPHSKGLIFVNDLDKRQGKIGDIRTIDSFEPLTPGPKKPPRMEHGMGLIFDDLPTESVNVDDFSKEYVKKYDRNDNQQIDLFTLPDETQRTEVEAGIMPKNNGCTGFTIPITKTFSSEKLFRDADTYGNKDGVASQDEIKARIKTFDRDHDGILNTQERQVFEHHYGEKETGRDTPMIQKRPVPLPLPWNPNQSERLDPFPKQPNRPSPFDRPRAVPMDLPPQRGVPLKG